MSIIGDYHEEIEAELRRRLDFMTARSAAWKKLAKNAMRWYLWSLANPGLALAKTVMAFNTSPPPNDMATLLGAHACEALGWAFLEYLRSHPEAPNYLEVTLLDSKGNPMYVTVQRPEGKTPHQMRVEVEGKLHFAEDAIKAHIKLRDELLAERDKLRSELESLKAQGECRS